MSEPASTVRVVSLRGFLILLAVILLVLASLGVSTGPVQVGWLGLALWAAASLVG